MWQGKVRYAHSTTPLSIQQEYPVLISPQHISSVAPSITFYLNYRGKENGDTSEKWCPSRESNLGVPDKWYVSGFTSTLDEEFHSHLTNNNFLDKISEIMHRKIPTHSRRIQALHENKKFTESASIFGKRLITHYKQADIPKMDWRNLLGHH